MGGIWTGVVALAKALGAIAALAAITAPALVEASQPHVYPGRTRERARPIQSADQIARETAAADAAEAACNAGALAGCADLGQAYETGAGRPQNRPVAELVYRAACDAGEANACGRLGLLLGDLITFNTEPDAAIRREAALLLQRSCGLGSLDGCDAEADAIERGELGPADPLAAEERRRAVCAAGRTATCLARAARLIEGDGEERDEGQALLDRLCMAGKPEACRMAVSHWRKVEEGEGPRTRAYQEAGCTAGHAWSCVTLGEAALAGAWSGGNGTDARARALSYLDRACTLNPYRCQTAALVREQPALESACTAGEAPACIRLGEAYADRHDTLADLPRALVLLEWACAATDTRADAGRVCERAARVLFDQWESPPRLDDPTRAEALLSRACTAGSESACGTLAYELDEGGKLALDRPRALALYEGLCESGYSSACNKLANALETDPAAPLTEADAEFLPVMTDAEREAYIAARHEQIDREAQARRAAQCTTTTVIYRGTSYTDTLCDNVAAVIKGFRVRAGEAPWQALLWRPETFANRRLAPADRVACGGTVIRTGWVLTAAHCLTDIGVPVLTGGHRIRLGVSNPLGDEGLSYAIRRVIPHPGFRTTDYVFDIALIQYDPASGTRGASVNPVTRIRLDPKPMDERQIIARMPAYTYGWGRTALEGGQTPSTLLGARLELRDPESCTRLTGFRDTLRGAVLCAAGARAEQACFGDSGGPLVSYADADRVPTLIGVVSAGVKCGRTGVPSRFTRIAHPQVQVWLDENLPGHKARQAAR